MNGGIKIILKLTIAALMLLLILNVIYLSNFLSPNLRRDANTLLVEGWMHDSLLLMAAKEFKSGIYDRLITTGLMSDDIAFFQIAENGSLVFYPRSFTDHEPESKMHNFKIIAYSEKGGKYSTHFNFYVNNSLVNSFISDKRLREFECYWYGNLTSIDSLTIEFDNDYYDKFGDRNLYIKEILINDTILISYQFNSVFYTGKSVRKVRIINNYCSYAERARIILAGYGIDSSKITAVAGKNKNTHKTLHSALAFKIWADTTEYKATGINIISQGVHGRRTFITYSKVIGNRYPIGIISLDYNKVSEKYILKSINVLHEVLSLIYYYIILIFV